MKRRTTLKLGLAAAAAAAGTAAGTVPRAPAFAGSPARTALILAHGSWHGAWCWGLVEPRLNLAGLMSIPIDFPGHGLNAVVPKSFRARPLDAEAFATEPSALAPIGVDAFADTVIAAADRARAMGAERVFAVGHSMGGVPITFAAARAPEKFTGLVYLAALAPAPEKPAGAYLGLKEQQEQSKLGAIVAADPAVVGAFASTRAPRTRPFQKAGKEALAADVDDGLWATAMHLFTPDAPVSMYGEMAEFAPGYEGLKRTFIRCNQDQTPRQPHLRRDRRGHEPGLARVAHPAHRPRVFPRGDVLEARGARGPADRGGRGVGGGRAPDRLGHPPDRSGAHR